MKILATPRKIACSMSAVVYEQVTGVDIDDAKLEMLRRGQAPIVETGIQELTRDPRRQRHGDGFRSRRGSCDRCVVCLRPAPPEPEAITRVAEQIGAVLAEKATRHVVVVRSTVQARHRPGYQPPQAASGLKASRPVFFKFLARAHRSMTTIIL